MISRILLDTAPVPGGRPLNLYMHDGDFTIKAGTLELMNSRMHGSEDALGRLACEAVGKRFSPRVLIGGLGMGFTLRSALDRLPRSAEVIVAELVPAVVKWNRGVLADLAGRPLDDPRVKVETGDVAGLIKSARNEYQAIILDIDNGPQGLTQKENDWLYNYKGLYAMKAALAPEGILAVWSAGRDDKFTRRLEAAGFEVEQVRVRAHAGLKGSHHLVWIARKKERVPSEGRIRVPFPVKKRPRSSKKR